MNNFNLFRTKMDNEARCRQKFETRFITEGAAPIKIHILRLDVDRDATMVFNDAEGPDAAIVFTPKQCDRLDNLLKQDYYTWDNKMYFVFEDIVIAREVNYIKQRAYQCNAKVTVLKSQDDYYYEQTFGGYFISSLRSYVDTELQQKINVSDKERPILIMPMQEWIAVGTKVEIGGKPWKIIDYDSITNPKIAYISLERDFFKKGNDMVEDPKCNELQAGFDYTFNTQDGYFNSSSPLNIKSRNEHEIVFSIPYGTESIEISTRKNGKEYKRSYIVKV